MAARRIWKHWLFTIVLAAPFGPSATLPELVGPPGQSRNIVLFTVVLAATFEPWVALLKLIWSPDHSGSWSFHSCAGGHICAFSSLFGRPISLTIFICLRAVRRSECTISFAEDCQNRKASGDIFIFLRSGWTVALGWDSAKACFSRGPPECRYKK